MAVYILPTDIKQGNNLDFKEAFLDSEKINRKLIENVNKYHIILYLELINFTMSYILLNIGQLKTHYKIAALTKDRYRSDSEHV